MIGKRRPEAGWVRAPTHVAYRVERAGRATVSKNLQDRALASVHRTAFTNLFIPSRSAPVGPSARRSKLDSQPSSPRLCYFGRVIEPQVQIIRPFAFSGHLRALTNALRAPF